MPKNRDKLRRTSKPMKLDVVAKRVNRLGVLIGAPVIAAIAIYFHTAEVSALRAENEFLRQTQYDKAFSIIDAQSKLRDTERRLVAESLSSINDLMTDIEKFSYMQSLPDDFSPKYFERTIQETAKKLKELKEFLERNAKK